MLTYAKISRRMVNTKGIARKAEEECDKLIDDSLRGKAYLAIPCTFYLAKLLFA